jgi:large subunit ribosomal protein L27
VGSTRNGRDSNAQYLGVKKFGNEWVKPGNIIVRQRGTKMHPGTNVYCSKDHSLHASVYGYVHYSMGKIRKNKMYVNVVPLDIDPAVLSDLKYRRVSWTKE